MREKDGVGIKMIPILTCLIFQHQQRFFDFKIEEKKYQMLFGLNRISFKYKYTNFPSLFKKNHRKFTSHVFQIQCKLNSYNKTVFLLVKCRLGMTSIQDVCYANFCSLVVNICLETIIQLSFIIFKNKFVLIIILVEKLTSLIKSGNLTYIQDINSE